MNESSSADRSLFDESPKAIAIDSRWQWLKSELRKRKKQFTVTARYTIFTGTWNVNGQDIGASLIPWLSINGYIERDFPPDFVFIALQEIDRRPEAYVLPANLSKEETWTATLLHNLQRAFPTVRYKRIISRSLVGIYASFFARMDRAEMVQAVSTSSATCGAVMGMMANKGAVAIRAKIGDDHICFVSSHLAPHIENVARRNQDYSDLSRRLRFGSASASRLDQWHDSAVEELRVTWSDALGDLIWDSDILIWAGDLNYRLKVPIPEARAMAARQEYPLMLQADQLSNEREHGRAFAEFEEALISFPPTFKYTVGSDCLDGGEKGRAPAWTDRILFRRADDTHPVNYQATMSILSSDHKPVACLFDTAIGSVVREKFDSMYSQLLKELDDLENARVPVTVLTRNTVDFGRLIFRKSEMWTVELLNTGLVPARWSFILKPGSQSFFPSWLRVKPFEGMLLPGQAQEIRLLACPDSESAAALNEGRQEPSDILIVHVYEGRDHFISIEGTWQPTIFCRSLADLADFNYSAVSYFRINADLIDNSSSRPNGPLLSRHSKAPKTPR